MSAAARRPLNWNVMIANATNLAHCEQKLSASDAARAGAGRSWP